MTMVRRKLLYVAYHFPPIQGSTGTSRTLAFSRYLREYGWEVCVLSINARAYEHTACENEALIAPHVRVERAWGLDTRKHLSVLGRYPLFLALPDRWQSWIGGGLVKGSRIINAWKPDIIMSTYPVPSAHVIGHFLHKGSGIPWVAEFRDPMLQPNYPTNSSERWAYSKVERRVFQTASEVVVTTGGCKKMYVDRYPGFSENCISIISNGFDPVTFADVPTEISIAPSNRLILLHSGLLYPHERDPTAFFDAVHSLRESGFFKNFDVEFRFRASGNEDTYQRTVKYLGIDSLVTFQPRIPYLDAIQEMQDVDALMIFQADNCNDQIPAKAYEYLYSKKPILGFTDPAGDTGELLFSVGICSIAKLEDSNAIEKEIKEFVRKLRAGDAFVVPTDVASRFSRRTLTGDLAHVLSRALR